MDGEECSCEIPTLTAPVFIISNCESVSVKKRTRDAFDIYFIFSGTDRNRHTTDLFWLAARFSQIEEQVKKIRKFLKKRKDDFINNVSQHARKFIGTAANETLALLAVSEYSI